MCFVRASSALGAVRCGGAANVIVSLGSECTSLRSSGYRNPESCILTLPNACALLPEARARCGNSARRDLCGGCRVTGIPTATGILAPRGNPRAIAAMGRLLTFSAEHTFRCLAHSRAVLLATAEGARRQCRETSARPRCPVRLLWPDLPYICPFGHWQESA